MALLCFWFRRACADYVVRGAPVPPDSRLKRHLADCENCREYLRSLSALSADLGSLIAVPRPSPQFAEPVWERIKPAPKPAPTGRLALATVAACGLACGWVVWRMAHAPASDPDVPKLAAGADVAPAPDVPWQGLLSPAPIWTPPVRGSEIASARQTSVLPAAARGNERTASLKWTHVRGAYRSRMVAKGGRTHRTLPDRLPSLARHMDLKESALLLEAQGDPGLANAAYQAAYEQRPSEDAAFDVGRSAEESGDMEQAMNVYAGLLESADRRSRAQKGWTP